MIREGRRHDSEGRYLRHHEPRAARVELMEAIGAKWPVRTADKVAAILNLIDKEQDQ